MKQGKTWSRQDLTAHKHLEGPPGSALSSQGRGTAEGTKENQKRGSHESQVIEISRRKELLTVPNQAEEPNRVRLRGEEPNELSLIR